MNTTYTVIKKCIAKGAIERREPNFLCHALIARDVVQAAETEELLHKAGVPDGEVPPAARYSPTEVRGSEGANRLNGIGMVFDSSPDLLFASLLGHQRLSKPQIDNLRRMVSELEAASGW